MMEDTSPFLPIFGLDFTSAPGPKKAITCACCELYGQVLVLKKCLTWTSFAEFEAFLQHAGPWVAALDFPFGQPLKLLTNVAWPLTWSDYVQTIAAMGKQRFAEALKDYQAGRAAGDKAHLRVTDKLAGACSPMLMQRVPVGKMFFAGAPRLLASGVSVLPCRPVADTRIVLEGYPALVARRWLGRVSYKSDERAKQTPERLEARRHMLRSARFELLQTDYAVQLEMTDAMAESLVQEPMGDRLDALLCAIQASWAYRNRDHGYGIPVGHDSEGWIVDPATGMLENKNHA